MTRNDYSSGEIWCGTYPKSIQWPWNPTVWRSGTSICGPGSLLELAMRLEGRISVVKRGRPYARPVEHFAETSITCLVPVLPCTLLDVVRRKYTDVTNAPWT